MTNRSHPRTDSAANALAALSSDPSASSLSRRRFLKGALMAAGATAAPTWLMAEPAEAFPLRSNDRILVVLMLGGGNDGLNMVAPAANGLYRDARGDLAIRAAEGLSIGGRRYLHPQLKNLHARFLAGDVAVVEGVGEAADDHSHFSSMARRMNGHIHGPAGAGATGWLGRYLDGANLGAYAGIKVGDGGVPLHMRGRNGLTTAVPAWGNLLGAEHAAPMRRASRVLSDISRRDSGLGLWGNSVARAFGGAVDAAQVLTPIYGGARLAGGGLTREMQLAARLINLDVGARVIAVDLGNFDDHDNQKKTHSTNMHILDRSIEAFFSMVEPRFLNRVALMTFSEFGRSFSANNSQGTDHGTASSSLVIGAPVRGGLYGQTPSFTNLDANNDLRHTVDFRSVYATVLDDWLAGDSREILGHRYETLDLFQPVAWD